MGECGGGRGGLRRWCALTHRTIKYTGYYDDPVYTRHPGAACFDTTCVLCFGTAFSCHFCLNMRSEAVVRDDTQCPIIP